jgi:hypothetical protein
MDWSQAVDICCERTTARFRGGIAARNAEAS